MCKRQTRLKIENEDKLKHNRRLNIYNHITEQNLFEKTQYSKHRRTLLELATKLSHNVLAKVIVIKILFNYYTL